jgi:energy-coupling factor transporter ATP-binding protein EcfA2
MMLLDDPTASVDPDARRKSKHSSVNLQPNSQTLVFSGHPINWSAACESRVRLKDGSFADLPVRDFRGCHARRRLHARGA